MQVACSRCRTRYKIPSEKLEAGPIKVRCKECDHVFGVRMKERTQVAEPPAKPVEAAAPDQQAAQGGDVQDGSPQPENTEQPAPVDSSQEEELISDASFGEDSFCFGDEKVPEADEAAVDGEGQAAAEEQLDTEAGESTDVDDFGFEGLEFGGEAAEEQGGDESAAGDETPEAESPEAAEASESEEPSSMDTVEFDLSDFDSSVFDEDDTEAKLKPQAGDEEPEDAAASEDEEPASDDDASPKGFVSGSAAIDMPGFGGADGGQKEDGEGQSSTAAEPLDVSSGVSHGFTDSSFEDFSGNEVGGFSSNESQGFPGDNAADEPLEQVEIDDLLTHPALDSSADDKDAPRLDLRKGDRRTESVAAPLAEPAQKKRLSVIWALLLSIIIGSVAFVGYNALVQPDAAFHFLNIKSVMQWLESGKLGNVLKLTPPVEGAYLERTEKDSLYVISGWITNTSSDLKSNIEVKGAIFGADGKVVAEQTSVCGNVIPQEQLMVLEADEIAARLTQKEGSEPDALQLKPGAKAPFMVVFSSPPQGIAKFTVEVANVIEPSTGAAKK